MPRFSLLGVLCFTACSSSSPPVVSDGPLVDQATGDRGPGAELRVDLARDLGPDAPRPPAQWKTIAGAPKVYRHTATLLKNGDLLIAGGFDENEVEQAAAYRYLAAQGQFVPAGKLATERAHHTASLLPDGRVLIAGGHSEKNYLKSTEIFDPAKPADSAWSPGPDLNAPLSEHAAVELADGRVLISGGWSYGIESNATLQIYDPTSGAVQIVLTMLKEMRRRHTATLLKNGKVLVAGGIQGGTSNSLVWTYLDSLEVFDPATATVTLVGAKMSYQRLGHTADLLLDGRVLIAGGVCNNKCKTVPALLDDLYDPATDSVLPLPHPGDFPVYHVSARLDDGRLLVAGGTIDDATKAYAYTPGPKASWDPLPPLAQGRTVARAVTLQDGTVLVVGGSLPGSGGALLDTAERLFP